MNIFFEIGVSQIPRILGLGDRRAQSKTYGCFDRSYWHYKTTDFANARFQEAALTLSLAFSSEGAENRYYHSTQLKDWILAAINFWLGARDADGSTSESYPHEHHFCSTALSLFAVSESLLLLEETATSAIAKTAEFVIQHNNKSVGNQIAGAAAALYNLYLLTNEHRYKDGFEEKMHLLFSLQNSKGFFAEYGGFDLGYDSITLSFLASLYKKTKRDDIKESALRCIKNMTPLIDEDGYFSCEAMSRKTQFLYPYGLALFNSAIVNKISQGLKKNAILNPQWMDDRYCIPFTNNYLMCAALR